jgi:serine/threonine protein phosphatase PrpC
MHAILERLQGGGSGALLPSVGAPPGGAPPGGGLRDGAELDSPGKVAACASDSCPPAATPTNAADDTTADTADDTTTTAGTAAATTAMSPAPRTSPSHHIQMSVGGVGGGSASPPACSARRLSPPPSAPPPSPERVLTDAFVATNEELLSHPELGPLARKSGTTAHVLYFDGPMLWVAACGDSRACLGRRLSGGAVIAVDLSVDHRPDHPAERCRIEAAGGFVTPTGPGGFPPARVSTRRGGGGLAMSRALGDADLKPVGVIAEPVISRFDLTPPASAMASEAPTGDEPPTPASAPRIKAATPPAAGGACAGDLFVILASDGIWEFVTCQEACELVATHSNATEAAASLVEAAAARWRDEAGDCTCRAGPHPDSAILAHTPLADARCALATLPSLIRLRRHHLHRRLSAGGPAECRRRCRTPRRRRAGVASRRRPERPAVIGDCGRVPTRQGRCAGANARATLPAPPAAPATAAGVPGGGAGPSDLGPRSPADA